MREDEFGAYVASAESEYALDLERDGLMERDEAREKARRDFASLFPAGRLAEGQFVRVIEDAETGAPLGRIHYAEMPRDSGRAWLYEIMLEEEHRGRGLGRQAMLLFEREARGHGFRRAGLNVFGVNARARHLYRSLGYEEAAIVMVKGLDGG